MPGYYHNGRPYKPKLPDELTRYPERGGGTKGVESGQKVRPLKVHDLGEACYDTKELDGEIEEGSEKATERRRKQEAAVESVRRSYWNRKRNGTQ